MTSIGDLTTAFNAITFAKPGKTDVEIVQYTIGLATSLKSLHDQNIVHRDICFETVVKTNDVYVLVKSAEQACDNDVASVCVFLGSLDKMSPERMIQSCRYVGSWKPDDVYALGCIFYRVIFSRDLPWARSQEWHEICAKKEEFRPFATEAKNMMATPQVLNNTLNFMAQWMLHPDPNERPDIALVCQKLYQIFPSHLPEIFPLACSVKQKVMFDLSNVELSANIALEVLKSNGLQSGYAYVPRKISGSYLQIIGSLEKNWVLLLPQNREDQFEGFVRTGSNNIPKQVENGTFKVGRRATVLEIIDGVWTAKRCFALSSRNKRCPLSFKASYTKEMWLYEKLGDSKLFPKHFMSFSYGNKSHKRLSLYESFPLCLFDQPSDAFTISHAHKLALKVLQLHTLGLVHRDIKDENVLVAEDGSFVLCDIDSVVLDEQWKNMCDKVGTDEALAPERYTDYTGSWFADDVYALGCLFYEKYSNKNLPWAGCSADKMLERKNAFLKSAIDAKEQLEADFSELANNDPEECGICLIFWMLHPDPKERPSMQTVCDVLEKICKL